VSDARLALRADCSRCAGLCCVAPTLTRSADFALDKPAGVPCPNLLDDFRCGVHDRLRPLGFAGCTVFDCFGAGQRTVQDVYGGRGWRDVDADRRDEMFEVFGVLRGLHELRWLLADVASYDVARSEAVPLADEVEAAATGDPPTVLAVDLAGLRSRVGDLLRRTSTALRVPPGPDLRGADLVGRSFVGDELAGADLTGSLLLGASVRGCSLRRTDLLGTDLRGCDVSGADLTTALFLTQVQVNAATGDPDTRLPGHLDPPAHWLSRPPSARTR
jgi:hypothetical protein